MPDKRVPAARKLWIVGLFALMAVSAGAWWLGAHAQSPEQAAAKAAEPDASWITATVENRVLAATIVLRGDVTPEFLLAVNAPSSVEGAGVVTRLAPAPGTEVREGQSVVEVSGRPVFVLQGDVPVYRSLKPGMAGADVSQLQAALSRLGFSPDMDGVFGEATKQSLQAFYIASGFEPVPAGTTSADLSQAEQGFHEAEAALAVAEATLTTAKAGGAGAAVVSAQAQLNEANRSLVDAAATRDEALTNARVNLTNAQNAYNVTMADPEATSTDKDSANAAVVQAQTALTAAQRQGDDAVAAASDQARVAKAVLSEARTANDVVAAQSARDAAAIVRDSAAVNFMSVTGSAGPTVPQGEVVFVPAMPARVQSAILSLGPIDGAIRSDGGPASTGIVQLAAGALVVTTTVRADDDRLVRAGTEVTLTDEATNATYPATITQINENQTVDAAGQVGRSALVTPEAALPEELAGVNLRITVTAAASDGEILVVPVAAVSAGADSTTRVSVLPDGSDEPVTVLVTVLLTADGFAGVEPDVDAALQPGDRVVVGR